ncbi:MAG: RNA polymerase sigma-70 factor [bacterium]
MARTASLADRSHEDPHAPAAKSLAEAALVLRVSQGDPAALEWLFRAYHASLCGFAFRYLQSADEADDAVQTVFVRIWNARAEWHVSGSLSDYLHLAVRNACRDRLQHDAVVRRWREKRVDELKSDLAGAAVASPELDASVAHADFDAMVERAIEELPARRREVFRLRFAEGLSYQAIATRLGVATKTVETQISRGLKHVRLAVQGRSDD